MRLLLIFLLSPLFLLSQTQIGNDIDGVAEGDNSGLVSISSDGTIVAIGAPGNDHAGLNAGLVRVFENVLGVWTQIGNDIYGKAGGDNFGKSVSLSSDGSNIAIGSPYAESAGHVRIFENIGNVWTQIGDDINGESEYIDGDGWQANFSFGESVSISDDGAILAIAEDRGSFWEPGYGNSGYIHVFENISGTWTLIGDYINTGISYLTDISISGDGSVVAISGNGDCPMGSFCFIPFGYVAVYKNVSAGVWVQLGSTFVGEGGLVPSNTISGVSLTNNGSKIAIGGKYTRVYENIDGEWAQQGDDIESDEYNNWPKISLSDNGNIIAIGGTATRVYEISSGNWTQFGVDINEVTSGDDFGRSIEISSDGTTLVVGAPLNDGNGLDAGHARVYDLSALLSVEGFNISSVKLYPNPTTNQFTIALPDIQSLEKVNMYNSLGQFIQTSDTQVIRTSQLTAGLYYVEVITSIGKATKKLIIH